MPFSHTNQITYSYQAGGQNSIKTVSVVETAGAEINISESLTAGDPSTTALVINGFEFQTAAQARSIYIRVDGFDCTVRGNDGVADYDIKALENGKPFVWSHNNTNNFPPDARNPLEDGTVSISVVPNGSTEVGATGSIEMKVLYDPTP